MGVITFNPSNSHPHIAEVEVLLGGIGLLCFFDGTVQFAENETYPDIVYSPRLTEGELEDFCKRHLGNYQDYYNLHSEKIDAFDEAPPITPFW